MRHRFWQPLESWMLRLLYPHLSTEVVAKIVGHSLTSTYGKAFGMGLGKTADYMASPAACRLRRGDNTGAAFRFPKGHVPANKGLRRPGWAAGRMRETQFKKGGQPLNTMPLWSFRWCDGYLMLKTGKPGPMPTSGWEYVHKLIWEQANGPLPDWRSARLWWKDGDHGNCSLDNLECLSGEEHMKRTTIHNYPPELKHTIILAGQLKRRIRERERGMEDGKK